MAKALIIDDDYGKLAHAYYALVPSEPINRNESLDIDSRTTIPKTSLVTLLSAIKAQAASGDDLVIVVHGNQTGMIIKLNQDARGAPDAVTARLNTLTGTESAADKARQLTLTEAMVKELLTLIDDCQKLKLGHVAFRGCSIGANTDNLKVLRDLFGAKAVSATDLLSTFGGSGKPSIARKPADFEGFKKTYGRNGTVWQDKVMFYSIPLPEHKTKTRLFARKKEDIAAWMQAMFDPSRKAVHEQFMETNVPVHYLPDTRPILPLDPGYSARIFTA